MSPEPLHIAFVGCGAATAARSATLHRLDPSVRLYYASRDRRRAFEYERRFAGAGSFDSYDGLLADGLIDAAYIATPPALHLPLALRALAAGKDVIVEKPAALSAADCVLLADASAAAGRRVLVAENYAYKPLTQTLRALVAAGAVGEVRLVQLNVLKQQADTGWRSGQGALFEGGVHWLHLLASIGPPVRSVRGFRFGSSDAERSMVVVAEYDGGAIGTLSHSWETSVLLRGVALSRIYGTHGSIAFESNGLVTLAWGRRKRLIPCRTRDLGGYRAMLADFISTLRDGTEPLMTLEQARRDLALVEAAYASS
jgi:predicted dehydrogenase